MRASRDCCHLRTLWRVHFILYKVFYFNQIFSLNKQFSVTTETFRFEDEKEYEYEINLRFFRVFSKNRYPGKPTSSPGRFSLALGVGGWGGGGFSRPAPKAREKRPGDEVARETSLYFFSLEKTAVIYLSIEGG